MTNDTPPLAMPITAPGTGVGREGAYRIFVSYSHEDKPFVRQVVQILRDNGLWPMWDEEFAFGHGFDQQIRNFIAHAHVFLPVITPGSSVRGWVHQEIGYGLALNVPVLPVAVGALPGQMLQTLHAIRVEDGPAGMDELRRALTRAVLDRLVEPAREPSRAPYQCAAVQEERSILMERHARDVLRLGYRGRVRQRQAHSAFDIPDKPVSHPAWRERYGPLPRSTYQCELIRAERLALGEHARDAGCSLILNLTRTFDQYGPAVRAARLKVLRAFLASMPDDKVIVAIDPAMAGGSLVQVGDWFAAESVYGTQGAGYRQTIFTRHAPSMQRRVEEFDAELYRLLEEAGVPAGQSRVAAIASIDRVLAELGAASA
jgi:hypothetical protein